MRPLAEHADHVAFWRRHTRIGAGIVAAACGITMLHALLAAEPPNRGTLVAIAAGTATLFPALLLFASRQRMTRHPIGTLSVHGLELVAFGAITVAALLDGGASSPLTLLLFLPLVHGATAYPPGRVVALGGAAVLSYAIIVLVGEGAAAAPAAVRARAAVGALTVAATTLVCALTARNHLAVYRRQARLRREATELASRDPLTGCLNHGAFHRRLAEAAAGAGDGRPLALMLIDIDDFKRVNDALGHLAGDAVLRHIARLLRAAVREGDAVGRLGGDEFAVLLLGAGEQEAGRLAERIRLAIRDRRAANEPERRHVAVRRSDGLAGTTVSIGVIATRRPTTGTRLFARADERLYAAKRLGGNGTAVGDRPATPVPPGDTSLAEAGTAGG